MSRLTSTLRSGEYSDDAGGNATGSGADEGLWTISKPLTDEAHLAGSGTGRAGRGQDAAHRRQPGGGRLRPRRQGTGPLVTRQGHLVRQDGTLTLDLWSADWKVAKGHRIGVRVTDANDDWWIHTGLPLGQTVTVKSGTVALPFQTEARKRADPGRSRCPARGVPERDGHGAAGDDRGLGVTRFRAAGPADPAEEGAPSEDRLGEGGGGRVERSSP